MRSSVSCAAAAAAAQRTMSRARAYIPELFCGAESAASIVGITAAAEEQKSRVRTCGDDVLRLKKNATTTTYTENRNTVAVTNDAHLRICA